MNCRKSDLKKDQFMKDFESHLSYKNNLQRIKRRRIPILDGRVGHLPPIEDTNEEVKEENQGRKSAGESSTVR